jgi:co-chaperonin GroES (HSP10)
MKMNDNYVLVKRRSGDTKTAGGIYIPELDSSGKLVYGEVVAVGPGKYNAVTDSRIPCTVSVGDRIIFTDLKAIELNIAAKNDKGAYVKTKYYQIPDSAVEVILEDNEDI